MTTLIEANLSWEARQLLEWKAGLSFTRPLASALHELQDCGLVGEGDILSSPILPKGRAMLKAAQGEG